MVHLESLAGDRGLDHPLSGMQALDCERLLLVLDRDLVDAARLRLAGPAEPDDGAGERLQFQGDVFEDVAEPGARAEPLEEPSALTDRAAMLDHRGQPAHEPVVEAGQRVRRVVLERAEIDPGFEDREGGPLVRTA